MFKDGSTSKRMGWEVEDGCAKILFDYDKRESFYSHVIFVHHEIIFARHAIHHVPSMLTQECQCYLAKRARLRDKELGSMILDKVANFAEKCTWFAEKRI